MLSKLASRPSSPPCTCQQQSRPAQVNEKPCALPSRLCGPTADRISAQPQHPGRAHCWCSQHPGVRRRRSVQAQRAHPQGCLRVAGLVGLQRCEASRSLAAPSGHPPVRRAAMQGGAAAQGALPPAAVPPGAGGAAGVLSCSRRRNAALIVNQDSALHENAGKDQRAPSLQQYRLRAAPAVGRPPLAVAVQASDLSH